MKAMKFNHDAYPNKQTINLVVYKRTINSPSIAIPIFLIFMVCLFIFVQLFVYRPLHEMTASEAEALKAQRELDEYNAYIENYDKVLEEYNLHFATYMTDEEKTLPDRSAILNLIKEEVIAYANLRTVSIQGDVCTLVLDGIALSEVSDLVARLEASKLVAYITVSTAATDNRKDEVLTNAAGERLVTASLTIMLNRRDQDAE